jgi:hypothetical protein
LVGFVIIQARPNRKPLPRRWIESLLIVHNLVIEKPAHSS